MKLHLEWQSPIVLHDGSNQNMIYACDFSEIPDKPGIYIFGRRHGTSFEALYVGKATSLNQQRPADAASPTRQEW
jgi:hypothetical protein